MAETKELQKEHLDLLLQASSLLNSTLSLDGVLSYLLREAVKIVGAQNGMILLLEEGELVTKTSIPESAEVSYSRSACRKGRSEYRSSRFGKLKFPERCRDPTSCRSCPTRSRLVDG